MKSVIVTGGSGKAGRAAIRELLAHGYQVMNVDTVAPAEPLCHFMKTDLNDLGQAVDAVRLMAGTIDRRAPRWASRRRSFTSPAFPPPAWRRMRRFFRTT
jgi:nucleoside-diphosphate-sugar epimerase